MLAKQAIGIQPLGVFYKSVDARPSRLNSGKVNCGLLIQIKIWSLASYFAFIFESQFHILISGN
jgi:hypothetical protein